MIKSEYFVKGTEPTETCDNHIKVTVCKDSGALSTEYCPAESLEEHVYINSANIPTTISPNVSAENAVAIMGNSQDLTYLMPETLKDNYCPVHSGIIPPVTDPSMPGEPVPPSDPANQYNEFFGPNNPNNTPTPTPEAPSETGTIGVPN